MSETYTCWKCGVPLPDVLSPLARHEECPRCRAQLHVCRMCVFFDATVAQQCREPVAEPVTDKQRANFCGYFQINPRAFAAVTDKAEAACRTLDALFGGEPSATTPGTQSEDALREPLEQWFRK
jgi:hypothetical protein